MLWGWIWEQFHEALDDPILVGQTDFPSASAFPELKCFKPGPLLEWGEVLVERGDLGDTLKGETGCEGGYGQFSRDSSLPVTRARIDVHPTTVNVFN